MRLIIKSFSVALSFVVDFVLLALCFLRCIPSLDYYFSQCVLSGAAPFANHVVEFSCDFGCHSSALIVAIVGSIALPRDLE